VFFSGKNAYSLGFPRFFIASKWNEKRESLPNVCAIYFIHSDEETAISSEKLEGQPVITEKTRGSVTAHKPYYHCNSSGSLLWTATVTGTFTYNGSTSSCTNASYDTQISNSSWSEQSGTAYPSGNSAIADVVMARRLLFIVVETVPVTITLTCDKNGNLS